MPSGSRKFSDKVLTKTYIDEWARFPQTDMKCDVSNDKNSRSKVTEAGKCQAYSGCITWGALGYEDWKIS